VVTGWRGLRFRLWTTRLRIALLRHRARLRLDAPWAVDFRGAPRVRMTVDGDAPGELALRVGRGARIEPGVRLQFEARAANALELGERVVLQDGVRIWLTGGKVRLGKGTILRDECVLKSGGELVIGEFVRLGSASMVHCHERIELADRAAFAECVVIVDSDHVHDGSDTWFLDQPVVSTPVKIGSNTVGGALVLITRGVTIGSNAVIAGASVIRRGEYPDGWLIAGSPAEPVRALGRGADDERPEPGT
jgi:acetyltransferase-like isoleucine patch superfamily enzyme